MWLSQVYFTIAEGIKQHQDDESGEDDDCKDKI